MTSPEETSVKHFILVGWGGGSMEDEIKRRNKRYTQKGVTLHVRCFRCLNKIK